MTLVVPTEILVELPAASNTVMTFYTTLAGFEDAPDAGEVIEYACEHAINPDMPYQVARHHAAALGWHPLEEQLATSALVTLQQDITTLLHGIGVHNPLAIRLWMQVGYKLLLIVTPRVVNNAPMTLDSNMGSFNLKRKR